MQFVFIDMAGKTLFVRDDAESAQWTQEEMSLECEFPYVKGKEISTGQRIFFVDPSTKEHQIYEIKSASSIQPDGYQQISAENIVISELTDEHIDSTDLTDVTLSEAFSNVLYYTQWELGNMYDNPVSSVSISRGSAWQGVLEIRDNYNVYLDPHVVLHEDGTIDRYINIQPPEGVFGGVRLSIDKNMLDATVTINDSELVTALYGYGGTGVATSTEEEETETTFEGITWAKTDTHPAKPYGQKYIEDPEATAKYGRNGRPRFGYYQNTDIDDPETLLRKTWESLSISSTPEVSIECTIADLYRMGYADQPIKLHDVALVEILPLDLKKQIQITKMTTDLLDPSATTLNIGDYIPNIIYINKETEESSSGGGGGSTNKSKQSERSEYETAILKNNRRISLRAYQNDLDDLDNDVKLQEARIDVEHNRITMEVTDRRNADGVLASNITMTASQIRSEVKNTASGLYSSITQTASQIRTEVRNTASGLQSNITQTASQIRTEVRNTTSGIYSTITQTASQIRTEVRDSVSGLNSSITQTASQIRAEVTNSVSGLQSSITQNANEISLRVKAGDVASAINQTAQSVLISASKINLDGYVTTSMLESAFTSAQQISTQQLTVSSYFTCLGYNATWKEKAVGTSITVNSTGGTVTGVTLNKTTLYYLGR